jgi:hypothetical protein
MRKLLWAMYLWPGLPQLWRNGNWTGLAVAFLFVAICNLLLLGSLAWSELIAQGLRTSVWAICGIAWGIGVVWSAWHGRDSLPVKNRDTDGDVFGEALNFYLKGDHFQAEQLLEKLLRANARDLDARLMLATLLRHAGRFDEAERHLKTLCRFDGVAKWQLEIEHERGLLAEARAGAKSLAETEILEDAASVGVSSEGAASDCVKFENADQLSACSGTRTSVARAA